MTGATGVAGVAGVAGAAGSDGAAGATGLTGVTGATGAIGSAGSAGVAGQIEGSDQIGTNGSTAFTLETGWPLTPQPSDDKLAGVSDQPAQPPIAPIAADTVQPIATTPNLLPSPATAHPAIDLPLTQFQTPKQDRN